MAQANFNSQSDQTKRPLLMRVLIYIYSILEVGSS